jgi:hypothetical protein
MQLRHLLAGIFFIGLFIGVLTTAEAEKMTVQVVDKNGAPVQGATVDVAYAGKKDSFTTDAKGECSINPVGLTCEIEAIKGDCKERLAPQGVLADLRVIITLHCWPPK